MGRLPGGEVTTGVEGWGVETGFGWAQIKEKIKEKALGKPHSFLTITRLVLRVFLNHDFMVIGRVTRWAQ